MAGETCSHHYTLSDDPLERIVMICGRACVGYESRIWRQDNPDSRAAPGEIGGRSVLRLCED